MSGGADAPPRKWPKDLTGAGFGRLVVLERDRSRTTAKGETFWLCECACGNLKVVRRQCLVQGLTKSCGCLREEAPGLAKHRDWTGARRAKARRTTREPARKTEETEEKRPKVAQGMSRKRREELRLQGEAFRASGFAWADVAQLIGLTEYETVQLCASEVERERWERKREGVAA